MLISKILIEQVQGKGTREYKKVQKGTESETDQGM